MLTLVHCRKQGPTWCPPAAVGGLRQAPSAVPAPAGAHTPQQQLAQQLELLRHTPPQLTPRQELLHHTSARLGLPLCAHSPQAQLAWQQLRLMRQCKTHPHPQQHRSPRAPRLPEPQLQQQHQAQEAHHQLHSQPKVCQHPPCTAVRAATPHS